MLDARQNPATSQGVRPQKVGTKVASLRRRRLRADHADLIVLNRLLIRVIRGLVYWFCCRLAGGTIPFMRRYSAICP